MSSPEEPPRDIQEVADLYRELTEVLEGSFGRRRPRWVRGEIQKVYEKSHLYLDLADAGSAPEARRPVLYAHAWVSQWAGLKRRLAQDGVALREGAVVNVYGYVDLYPPSGRLGFSVLDIDVAGLLGDAARRRLELLARLEAAGLLEANGQRPLAAVPLRVGLVASPATEGYRDFVGQLERSGFAFRVLVAASAVQGDGAASQVAAAIATVAATGVDLVCVVRGGGSRQDLSTFDDEEVARAIATCPVPVWTGIGHTGDEAVADLVAARHAITPTRLGEDLVAVVDAWHRQHVRAPAGLVAQASRAVLDEAGAYLGERRRTTVLAVRDRLRGEGRQLATARRRLVVGARHRLDAASVHVAAVRQLLAAYDPQRRLLQGWALVTRADGVIVRRRSDVGPGDPLAVRVSDGSISVRVIEGGGT